MSRTARVVLLGLAAFALIFVLPWFVPAHRSASDSWLFGFNNAFAILGVGAVFVALTLPGLLGRPTIFHSDAVVAASRGVIRSDRAPGFRVPAIVLAVVAAAVGLAFWAATASSYFGESSSFLGAIDLVLMGKHVYSDFQWPYGPLFIYGPIAISAFTGGSIRIDAAYVLSVAAEAAAGIFFLAALVRRLDVPRRFGLALFVLVGIAGLNLTMGENYTHFRFALPFAAFVYVDRRALAAANANDRASLLTIIALLAGAAALVSPEIALVTAFGLAALSVGYARNGMRWMLAGAPLALLSPAAVAALCSKDYFFLAIAFGGGGYSFPVLPNAHLLFFVASALFAVPLLALRGVSRDADGPLCLALAVASTLFVAPALGRCDPGHVYWNGIVVFVVSAALLVRISPRIAVGYLAAFGVVFSIGTHVAYWIYYGDNIRHALAERQRLDAAGLSPFANPDRLWARGRMAGSPFLWAKMPPPDPALQKLDRFVHIGTPVELDELTDRYLKLRGKFVPEKIPPPIIGIFTDEQVATKEEGVRAMDVILFPRSYRSFADPLPSDAAEKRAAFLSGLMLFPFPLREFRNEPYFPERAVVADILAQFQTVDTYGGYDIMVRNPGG